MKKDHNKGYHTDKQIEAMQKAAKLLGKIKQAEFNQHPYTMYGIFKCYNN